MTELSVESMKEELLALLLEEETPSQPETIVPADRNGVLPLSYSQQRVWFIERLGDTNGVYNIPVAFEVSGPLDRGVLERALNEVVRRHEVLRTTFAMVEGAPVQVIAPAASLAIDFADLGDVPAEHRQAQVTSVVHAEACADFDLEKGPLLRARLVAMGRDVHVFVMTFHHIVFDDWSMGVLLAEVTRLYRAFATGTSPQLPPLSLQYADFAAWQQQQLAGELSTRQLEFWKTQLAGAPALLSLPTDRARPAMQTHLGGNVPLVVPAHVLAGLNRLSQQSQATLFMTLLSAFNVLLSRYAGQEDICVGTPIANRQRVELESLIGFFVNTLVLRTRLEGEQSFRELLRNVKATTLDAYANQDVPFEKIVEHLAPQRDGSHSPLFQVMFVLLNAPLGTFELPGLKFNPVRIDQQVAKFDLTLTAFETAHGLRGYFEYNTDLFERATVERMAAHFNRLLEAIVANPQQPVGGLPLLIDAERQQLLVAWNRTAHEFAHDKCIHELFEAQVERTPQNVAVVFEGTGLTYRQLSERANQLAHHLRSQGVGPDRLVGICIERSVEMVVGLLGILKAGGAYVPLDPSYPSERLAYMLQDASPVMVLTQQSLLGRLPESVPLLCLDSQWGSLAMQSTANPARVAAAQDLAYVIYTSGSTGRPKGVAVEHAGVVNRLQWMQGEYGLIAADRVLQKTPFSFDVSVWEFFWPLLHGAQLVVARPQGHQDPQYLVEIIERERITTMHFVPPMLEAFLDAADEQRCASLRQVMCSGQALPFELTRRFFAALPSVKLHNLYGPTEASVDVSAFECLVDSTLQIVPIGRPIWNTRLCVLDALLQPVPVGVTGELHIGGICLARGYLNRPELTAEKFIPDPHGESGSRLYKTGDLARVLPDGNIEYLGRLDDQVKIRGFRIELGEIESQLRGYDGVREAVVSAREDVPGERRLVGYVVAQSEAQLSVSQLQERLREVLPEYMVPSAWVMLDALPLSPNGKVDRKALPAPDASQLRAPYVAPRTETELVLCEIWQSVLGVERVGVTDNFFLLGGHSLLAVRLINAVQRQFSQTLSLRGFMEKPTVAQLAGSLLAARGADQFEIETIVPDREREHEPFPLTPVQLAYWLGRKEVFELGNVGTHAYAEIPVAGIDAARFERALNQLIARHGMLRMVITAAGEQRILANVPPYTVHVTDLRAATEQDVQDHLREVRAQMSHQVFSGEQWPLFDVRVTLLAGRAIIHTSTDAMMLDASSTGILIEEISLLYADPQRELPPLELSFRDYVLARQRFQSNPLYLQARQYWERRAEDFPQRPDLPLAVDPSQIAAPRFERRRHHLPAEQWQALVKLAQRHQVTPTVLFLCCFGEVLSRWSQQPRFALNLTLFNRMPVHPQVDAILGDFTTLTLLELDFANVAASFADRLCATQRRLWSDLEHRYFDGIEVLQSLQRANGHSVSYPVVVTSTLALEQQRSANDAAAPSAEQASLEDDATESYGITQTSQVWLDVHAYERGDGLGYNWDSVVGLFPEGMIDDMFETFNATLTQLARDERSWEAPLKVELPRAQRALVESVNATARSFQGGLLHDPLLTRIQQQPDKAAVRTRDKELTYGELGLRSAQLAKQLLKGGARRNQPIAIIMEKGWEQVVAVLGIVRAGAAYVPIDASWPRERIEVLLSSVGVEQVVTSTRHESSVPQHYKRRYVITDALPRDEALGPIAVLEPRPEDLAYVIFTSGSTGLPKGVMTEHGAALNTVLDINERYGVVASDSVFGLSNLSFDLSVYDIFGVLGAGGTLVLPMAAEYRDPSAWLAYLKNDPAHGAVTVWNTVPALLQMLIEVLAGTATTLDLRVVLLSGDWIPVDLPERIRALAPNARVVSLGGATEASIWSIAFPIDEVKSKWKSIPYGKALANQQMYVLQRDLSPAPVWVRGDLYIGGIGLARGYLGDEQKTANSFIRHPRSGVRLYKTGDRGRLLPDGNIEFLGREDHQVKIQGYRIELGEIEARLKSHPHISDAVVIVHTQERMRRLVAYVVGKPVANDQHAQDEAADRNSSVAEKLEFKSAQKGVRRAEDRPVLELPSSGAAPLALRAPQKRRARHGNGPITLGSLNELLRAYSRRSSQGYLLPKAYYPSGGSLYPVQVYLQIGLRRIMLPGGGFVPEGYYYYQPLTHQLIKLSSPPAEEAGSSSGESHALRVFLVADLDAIEPLYGAMSDALCRLEAGYMSHLLECNRSSDVAVWREDFAAFERRSIPETGDQHCLLAVFSAGPAAMTTELAAIPTSSPTALVAVRRCDPDGCEFSIAHELPGLGLSRMERKSYRNYSSEAPSLEGVLLLLAACGPQRDGVDMEVYVHVRKTLLSRASEHSLAAGLYLYEVQEHRLKLVRAVSHDVMLFPGDNETIERAASFSVIFVGTRERAHESYEQAGMAGQALCDYGLTVRIGLCPIGVTQTSALEQVLQLQASDHVFHALLGGTVTAEQIAAMEESSAPSVDVVEEVLSFLRAGLPHYMIPQQLISLPSIPLTANGKVDRKALPQPDLRTLAHGYEAPEGEVERTLAGIWQELLQVPRVGRQDNFFELGGNSLLAIKVVNRLREALGIEAPIRTMYSFPTVKAFAANAHNVLEETTTPADDEEGYESGVI